MPNFLHLLPGLNDGVSVVAIGLGVAGFALLAGRRLLGVGARPPDDDKEESPAIGVALLGAGAERRTMTRRRGNFVPAQVADDSDMAPTPVWVIDRSLGGVCLMADAPVVTGSHLRVRPNVSGGTAPWTPVRVCICRRQQDNWMLHCQFLRPLPTNIMLLFG